MGEGRKDREENLLKGNNRVEKQRRKSQIHNDENRGSDSDDDEEEEVQMRNPRKSSGLQDAQQHGRNGGRGSGNQSRRESKAGGIPRVSSNAQFLAPQRSEARPKSFDSDRSGGGGGSSGSRRASAATTSLRREDSDRSGTGSSGGGGGGGSGGGIVGRMKRNSQSPNIERKPVGRSNTTAAAKASDRTAAAGAASAVSGGGKAVGRSNTSVGQRFHPTPFALLQNPPPVPVHNHPVLRVDSLNTKRSVSPRLPAMTAAKTPARDEEEEDSRSSSLDSEDEEEVGSRNQGSRGRLSVPSRAMSMPQQQGVSRSPSNLQSRRTSDVSVISGGGGGGGGRSPTSNTHLNAVESGRKMDTSPGVRRKESMMSVAPGVGRGRGGGGGAGAGAGAGGDRRGAGLVRSVSSIGKPILQAPPQGPGDELQAKLELMKLRSENDSNRNSNSNCPNYSMAKSKNPPSSPKVFPAISRGDPPGSVKAVLCNMILIIRTYLVNTNT